MEMLSKDNYDTWCLQIEALLIKNDTWEIVNGEVPRPPNPPGTATEQTRMKNTLSTWITKDRKAKADIILSIDPLQLKQIIGCETSNEIWKKLESIYASTNLTRKTNLLKQLIQQKIMNEDDVLNHINTFFNVVYKLEAMDVKIHDVLSAMLLYSLPKNYDNLQRVIETQDVLPRLDELKVKIIEATRRNQTSSSNQQSLQRDEDHSGTNQVEIIQQNNQLAAVEPEPKLHHNESLSHKSAEEGAKTVEENTNENKLQILYDRKNANKCSFVNVPNIISFFVTTHKYALAHCVSEDLGMDGEIAVEFSKTFKEFHKLYEQKQKEGGLAILQNKKRFIYYLITRKRSNDKATTDRMRSSLQKLQQHVQEHGVKNLAIPRTGCDLDSFAWITVRNLIEYAFRDTDVKITVYNFQQPQRYKTIKCLTWHVSSPLMDMYSSAAIIYFGTLNGHISKEIHSLDMEFQIMQDYVHANKMLGDVIQVYKHQGQYLLLGCITRTTQNDNFNFTSFQECIVQIKTVTENIYRNVSIKAFCDDHDDLLLDKIINMLRYSLRNIELYVIWPDKI